MNIEQEIKSLFTQLVDKDLALVKIDGSPIHIKLVDDGSKLVCSTPVYLGGNYIPKSVRMVLNKPPPAPPTSIRTYLKIDEGQFQIDLVYLGKVDHFNTRKLQSILEEFSVLAGAWRHYLDEHGHHDLIHIHVK